MDRRPPRRATLVATVLLHLVAGFPYLLSPLVAPISGALGMGAVWLLLGVVAVAVHRRWGALAALVPLLAVALWFAMVSAGSALLGWTA